MEEFSPDESEDRLYNLVTAYLQRDNLQALPASQRSLMTLVLRKLLASSTFAIAGALSSISNRLQKRLDQSKPTSLVEELDEDYEALDETVEEWANDEPHPMTEADQRALKMEIAELREFAALATSIEQNAKGRALLKALEVGFAKAREFGADEKAIIFTESRKTQSYLLRVLVDSPWADHIVLFNGTNTDLESKAIYQEWLSRNAGSDRAKGSKTADMRSALVDYFRERGKIMIATEVGAEGINLQFCAMVVNYDLPWNPQRIEQRIGRCHRYGQKHDVVVVNFLNRKNEADQRVYQLLSEKFQLFEGVFGASDEVLGVIESGVDFEKRIAGIYQQCRQTGEIRAAFDQLQQELTLEINEAMTHARQKLLENFDDEVREKLKVRNADTNLHLNQFERQLMRLAKHELNGAADFVDSSSFRLNVLPDWIAGAGIPIGLYELPRRTGDAHFFRVNHPLGEAIVSRARARDLPAAENRVPLFATRGPHFSGRAARRQGTGEEAGRAEERRAVQAARAAARTGASAQPPEGEQPWRPSDGQDPHRHHRRWSRLHGERRCRSIGGRSRQRRCRAQHPGPVPIGAGGAHHRNARPSPARYRADRRCRPIRSPADPAS